MFDLDQFIADCRAAQAEDGSHKAVQEVVARAVADPAGVLAGLGEPKRAAVGPMQRCSLAAVPMTMMTTTDAQSTMT